MDMQKTIAIRKMMIGIKDALDINHDLDEGEVDDRITALMGVLAPLYWCRRRGKPGMPTYEQADHLMDGALEGMSQAMDELVNDHDGPAAVAVQRVAEAMVKVVSGLLDGRYTAEDFEARVKYCLSYGSQLEAAASAMGKGKHEIRSALGRADTVMQAAVSVLKASELEMKSHENN